MTQDGEGTTLTAEEKRDRQMVEVLQELRIAMPGVQILFGFLLVVPFSARFGDVTDFQRHVYFVTLLLTSCSTACLIAPTAAHRIRFHQGDRTWLVETASDLLIAGLVFLALALIGAVLLVTDFLFDGSAPFVWPALVAAVFAVLWFLRPLVRGRRRTG